MRAASVFVLALVLALAGCGGDDSPAPPVAEDEEAETVADMDTAADREDTERPRAGTKIVASDSEFGRMLFGADDQAIYIFENDSANESNCYGECAAAWPPVFTDGPPEAVGDVDEDLLGTTKRRGGARQVTYNGKPLYFYAHEKPGEVRCHNVFLNGGLWWVIGPDGERRP